MLQPPRAVEAGRVAALAEPRPTVLIVNLGTPRRAAGEDVRRFLSEFLADPLVVDYPPQLWRPILDRLVLRLRPERVAEMYGAIASPEGLPLAVGTRRIAKRLQDALGAAWRVRAAYRYGTESLREEILRSRGADSVPVFVVPLFPQRTSSSSETIVREARLASGLASKAADLHVVRISPDDPGYVAAVADRIRRSFERGSYEPQHLLFSFHGIPWRYDRRERGVYRRDCERTVGAVLRELRWPAHGATLAYQSRFGPEPWIGPRTATVVRRLARSGIRRLAVVMPGFLTDGIETLDEIGVRARKTFLESGGEAFVTVPAVDHHPSFVRALHDGILAAHAAWTPGEASRAQ